MVTKLRIDWDKRKIQYILDDGTVLAEGYLSILDEDGDIEITIVNGHDVNLGGMENDQAPHMKRNFDRGYQGIVNLYKNHLIHKELLKENDDDRDD